MLYRDKTGSWFLEESRILTGEEIIMNITVRKYEEKDLPDLIRIWNEVVEDGVAFPQEEYLNEETGKAFFAEQTYTAAFTSFIRIISEDVDISAMPAMR